MSGITALAKIIDRHLRETLPDGRMVLSLNHVWCHEITTPNAILDMQARGCDVVFDPNKIKAMIDHVTPAKDTASAVQGKILRDWCNKHGIQFLDVGRNGVCHAIIPEKGWIRPGQIGIMGDSHTCTHGAFCAFTAGVGSTELEIALMTGLWICSPQKVIYVNYVGTLPGNVFSKDLILETIRQLGVKGATNAVLEFGGPVIAELSMDARMTMTNMAVEAGATSGMMMVDQRTIDYLWPVLKNDFNSPAEALVILSQWNSDPDCLYDMELTIDVTSMVPMITQNYSPGDVVPVSALVGKPVDQVYISSCTNGRLEDLIIAADIFEDMDKPVADGVRCVVVPATPHIWQEAMTLGLFDVFMKAGCCISNPSCGACLGMSCGVIAPGEVCVSTTNRNFPGRMGQGGMVHLVSPATAAMTAMSGVISLPPKQLRDPGFDLDTKVEPTPWTNVPIKPIKYGSLAADQTGSGGDFSGRAFYLPQGDVDTDQIIPAKYLTLTDKVQMGRHCLEDAEIPADQRVALRQSKILVAGDNFGCGSSREHAPWALEAAGIRCVIAPSFARIFYNNMFANGLLCIQVSLDDIERLFSQRPVRIAVDLEKCVISWLKDGRLEDLERLDFMLTDYQRELIASGGSIGSALRLADRLAR